MHLFHAHHLKPFVLRFVLLAISLTSTASLAGPWAARLGRSTYLFVSADPLKCSPSSLWFERVAVGKSKSEPAFMVNTGSTTITILTMTQNAVGFELSGLNLPLTLRPGQRVQFTVSFIPQVSGHVNGTFAFTSDASGRTLSLYVHGTGFAAGNITASPSAVVFGSVQVGNSGSQSETLTNSGSSSVTVSQVSVSGTGFSTSGLNLPITLTPGQSASFSLGFTPPSGGSDSGNLSVISNALNSALSVSLSGLGFTPGVLSANPASTNLAPCRWVIASINPKP